MQRSLAQLDISNLLNSGGVAGDTIYWNGTNWVRLAIGALNRVYQAGASAPAWNAPANLLGESAEQSVSVNTGGVSTALGSGQRWFSFFTLPTTYKFIIITGIQWRNGATVGGLMIAGVDLVDANPPTIAPIVNVAITQEVTATGINTTQRANIIASRLVALSGSPVFGVWFQSADAASKFFAVTLASQNAFKTLAYGVGIAQEDNSAWTASTTGFEFTVFYKGYN